MKRIIPGNRDSQENIHPHPHNSQLHSTTRPYVFWLLLLSLIGILVYLPLIGKMGLVKDDWYLIYDAHAQGAQYFHEIYQIDRPARAYVMQIAYGLFGDHIPYYHLTAYLFRMLASWALFWTLDTIWPEQRKNNFLIALLLLIYPGFLSQPNPIDYQSQILSLCLAFASIALSVKAIHTPKWHWKVVWTLGSLITGLIYPALVEYMVGLEVLRVAFIVQIVSRDPASDLKKDARRIFQLWIPFVSTPTLFLIWRIFFFESERRATDVVSQLGQLFVSPLTGVWWLVNWFRDIFRVTVLAWYVPFNDLALNLRLKELLVGLGLGILVLLLLSLAVFQWQRLKFMDAEDDAGERWKLAMLITGACTTALALLPVIIVNRHADFGEYSRYSLASAVGVAMILVVFVLSIRPAALRFTFLGLIVFMAVMTHYANALSYVQVTEQIKDFWWQVAWRAPNIQPGTTLVANYPVGAIQEDYFIWGPANLVYYPEKQSITPIPIILPAAVLTEDVVLRIMMGKGEETPLRRGNIFTRDFSNVLVLAQASEHSCVRLIDGANPNLSTLDAQRIMLIARDSKLDNVITDGDAPLPSSAIFGDEPVHGWCYYYQKADLARQRGDWEEVARLAEEVDILDLRPNDQIEWMPFLQSYALLNERKHVKEISTRINTELFYQEQACTTLSSMTEKGQILLPEMLSYVNELFCK